MSEPRDTVWILDRVAQAAYERFLSEFGTRFNGHDPVRLATALAWPRTVAAFATERPRLSVLAAAHARAINRLKPFDEGNDAMACLLSMLFLRLNGIELPAPAIEKYTVFAALADERLDATGLAQWMRMRYIANRQGVQWVAQVRIRGGKVHSVATVRSPNSPSGKKVGTRRRTALEPPQ
ncbi:MAG: hypothetical protein U1E86_22495 [Burkholderiaceae bacterium]